jgi:hypothetical protein
MLRGQSLRRELERGLVDLHALEVGRRAHRRRVLAGMQGPKAGASREAEANAVILLMQDAKRTRCLSGDLTTEPGGQVVRAANRSEELEARIRQLPPPGTT